MIQTNTRILYGTGNPVKLDAMRRRLAPLGLKIVGLKDLNTAIPDVMEDGNTPLENARKEALAYYEAFRMPVYSIDSGLYIDNIPEHRASMCGPSAQIFDRR